MREGTSLTVTVGQLEASRCGPQYLTSGNRLVRNTLWNLIGNVAPLLLAFFCIPSLVRALGTSRFGILTLVWVLIGYATVFDFGLGRALDMVFRLVGSPCVARTRLS